jgi:hypothetical protein
MFLKLLLHVWGSLGSATLTLLQQCTSTTLFRFLSYETMLDGLRFIVVQQCNQQYCYARNNKTHVSMVFRILLTSSVCWNLLEWRRVLKSRESSVCWNSLECRRVFGYGLPFGWKIKVVSGNCERSTWVYTVDGEDIRSSGMVNGRLMMDYTPRCRCGVQVDR